MTCGLLLTTYYLLLTPRRPSPRTTHCLLLTVYSPCTADYNVLTTYLLLTYYPTKVLATYRRARRRAIFLDWGGTLVAMETQFDSSLIDYYRSELPQPTHHCLEELAQDPRNLLMVLSGQEMSKVRRASKV